MVDVDDLLARCEFPDRDHVVCAVSGGSDSMALLYLACAAGHRVTAVHVDHGLRPGSGAEAELVAAAAARFGAAFEAKRVTIDQPARGAAGRTDALRGRADDHPWENDASDTYVSNLEAKARDARRRAIGPGGLYGHTADDQAETVLLNLLRGAGVEGLSAMRAAQGHPILGLRRWETVALCEQLDLTVVRDPMNDDPRFWRTRIRHEVLPLLAEISGRDPVPQLSRTAGHAQSMADLMARLIVGVDAADTRALRAMDEAIAKAALRNWLRDDQGYPPSTAELTRAWAVVTHEVVACELSGGRRLSRHQGMLRLHPPTARTRRSG